MKIKIKAESKDILILLVFGLVILYFVGIGVLNIASITKTNSLHGFNPLPAFSNENIGLTMVVYIIILIIIVFSVSSYFFELEKGIGINFGKKQEKGYARWLSDKEMKKELKLVYPHNHVSDVAGVPLINNGKELWVDDGEYHNLIIGSTGSGKTQVIVHPLVKILSKKGESMIVTDPKGEIFEESAALLRKNGYNIVLLNFREPQRGNAWNPLMLPYNLYKNGNQDKANELLDDLARNILYDESAKGQDPFWENTSADYFAGLSLALFEDAKEAEINLNSINYMSTVGEEKALTTDYMKEYFSHKSQTSPAYINVVSTLMAPSETKGSILSVFKQKIKLFSSRENLSEMLSHSDFDIKDIGRKKTAVFLVVHDEKKTYHSLVTIFIKQCYETLIDVAQENGGKLPFRTNFILDEFANMPPLKDVTTMVTAARSRNIRFNFIIQNFAQLYQVYGKENGDTIKGNCGNIIYLISSELSALEEISKMCGEQKSGEKEKTASTPLVTVSDLQRLPQWESIILRTRKMPFRTKLTPNYKINWGDTIEKSSFITRDRKEISIFDLKKFVEQKRQDLFRPTENILGNDIKNIFGSSPTTPPNFPPTSPNQSLDMDDLIKRIDQKIAELEEEERRESEKNNLVIEGETSENNLIDDKNNQDESINEQSAITELFDSKFEIKDNEPDFKNIQTNNEILESKLENNNLKIEKNVDDIKTTKNNRYITDDQFFDDFFNDDE